MLRNIKNQIKEQIEELEHYLDYPMDATNPDLYEIDIDCLKEKFCGYKYLLYNILFYLNNREDIEKGEWKS